MESITQKRCTVCAKTFPATREFFGHYARNGKFKPNCRECERAREVMVDVIERVARLEAAVFKQGNDADPFSGK